jgi:NAD(P)H-flavin reductase/ferredoxin
MALLWVHTQRVPAAKTNPPRGLMLGLLACLTLLSLIKPALSQAAADLGTVVARLEFDWFYLPTYALIGHWGAANTWLLVGGATALLLALPWLPPRRLRGVRSWSMAVQPDDRIVTVRVGETLLDAGLREGLPMPFDCRNGACGVCKCTLRHGEVKLQPHLESALSAAERASGQTLLCCAEPLSEVEIEYLPLPGARAAPVRQHLARVTRLELLTSDVMRVDLQIDGGASLPFHAGQYINVILGDGARRSFSFASAPHAATGLEMHVRRIEGGRFTPGVFTTLRLGDPLRIEGPLGAFTLREDSEKPILFVAGATGFAPVKSMLEHAFHCGLKREMVLYWGVRRRADLYLGELAQQWALEHANFKFVPVLSDAQADDRWSGRTGLVHEAILADFPDLSTHQVYACGSVQMVQAAQPAFAQRGLASADCFSDAFHLAPQRPLQGQDADLVKLGGSHV